MPYKRSTRTPEEIKEIRRQSLAKARQVRKQSLAMVKTLRKKFSSGMDLDILENMLSSKENYDELAIEVKQIKSDLRHSLIELIDDMREISHQVKVQPPQTLPPQTLPPQTLPPQTLPPQTLPPQTLPPQTLPQQTLPPQQTQTQPQSPYPFQSPITINFAGMPYQPPNPVSQVKNLAKEIDLNRELGKLYRPR